MEHFGKPPVNNFQSASVSRFDSFASLDEFLASPSESGDFSIIHVNVRDLHVPERLAHLDILVNGSSTKFDVLVVTETWLSKNEEIAFVLNDFTHVSSPRESRSGGGVSVFIRCGWSIIRQSVKSCGRDEVQTALITISKQSTTISVIAFYARSFLCMDNLHHALELELLQKPPGLIILIGDSNIDLFDRHRSLPYVTFMASRGFEPFIRTVTRPASSTCIDHIWLSDTTGMALVVSGRVETATLADHFPVFLKLIGIQNERDQAPTKRIARPRRIFSIKHFRAFICSLQELDWSPVLTELDPDISYEKFYSTLFEAYNACFPLKKFKSRFGSKVAVWFDNALRQERRALDLLAKQCRATKSSALKELLNRRRAAYRRTIKLRLQKYHADIVHKYYGKPNKLWQHLNKCMGRKQRKCLAPTLLEINGKKVSGTSDIADAFCEYFSTIGQNTVKHLEGERSILGHFSGLHPEYPIFSLSTIEPACIVSNAKNMKVDLAGSITTIPSKVIKQCIGLLVVPLCHIFNASIRSKTFPSKLKDTIYIPIFKGKGSLSCPSNYRPIALTSFFGKLFERCIVQQMATHLETMDFFSKSQFGFRPKCSTDTALCSIANFAARNCEGGNAVLGVFLDVAKAFDCVSHDVLFDLMHYFGVSDPAIGWFRSYFANRKIAVKMQDVTSAAIPVTLGIPQGSVLGPFLFIYYFNALLILIDKNCPGLHAVTYADDTTLLYTINKTKVAASITQLNVYLAYVHDLFGSLKLRVNAQKTRVVLFKSVHCRIDVSMLKIELGGTVLEFSDSVECLGLMFSSDLKWREHYYKISKKAYGTICTFARLRRLGYDQKLLISLYRALLEPVIFYGLPVWGNTFSNTKRLFQTIQNDAFRAIYGVRRQQSVRFVFNQQQILDVNSAIKLKVALLVFKAVHLGLPLSFSLNNGPKSNIYELRSNRQSLISQPFCRTVLSEQSPEIAFVKLWNSIPVEIRESSNLKQFKRRYMAQLLQPS